MGGWRGEQEQKRESERAGESGGWAEAHGSGELAADGSRSTPARLRRPGLSSDERGSHNRADLSSDEQGSHNRPVSSDEHGSHNRSSLRAPERSKQRPQGSSLGTGVTGGSQRDLEGRRGSQQEVSHAYSWPRRDEATSGPIASGGEGRGRGGGGHGGGGADDDCDDDDDGADDGGGSGGGADDDDAKHGEGSAGRTPSSSVAGGAEGAPPSLSQVLDGQEHGKGGAGGALKDGVVLSLTSPGAEKLRFHHIEAASWSVPPPLIRLSLFLPKMCAVVAPPNSPM